MKPRGDVGDPDRRPLCDTHFEKPRAFVRSRMEFGTCFRSSIRSGQGREPERVVAVLARRVRAEERATRRASSWPSPWSDGCDSSTGDTVDVLGRTSSESGMRFARGPWTAIASPMNGRSGYVPLCPSFSRRWARTSGLRPAERSRPRTDIVARPTEGRGLGIGCYGRWTRN